MSHWMLPFMKIIFSIFYFLVMSFTADAYYVTTFKSEILNYDLPTHVMVAGAGDQLFTQFQEVATAKALKYYELNSGEQIVLITAKEIEVDNSALLTKWGFIIQHENKGTFEGKTFIAEMLKFNKIISLDIFSHSTAQYGIHLDGRFHRLSTDTKNLIKLKSHFLKDAYVFLHGCNAGYSMAPYLSELWEIPVAGAMTSSNFHKLHSDGNFYLDEVGSYPNSNWAKINDKSFVEPVKCREGACLRLKPDNVPYLGFWGSYREGGLPFYKFLCVKNTYEDCTRVMAKSMLSFVSNVHITQDSSLDEYKKAVVDFLCPINSKNNLRQECEENLVNALSTGDETYNPFSRPQIECDFKGCKAQIKCKPLSFLSRDLFKPGSCELVRTFNGKSTTIVREFKAYLDGFKSLRLN